MTSHDQRLLELAEVRQVVMDLERGVGGIKAAWHEGEPLRFDSNELATHEKALRLLKIFSGMVPAPPADREGDFILVPREPTDQMICAALDQGDKLGRRQTHGDAYRAMIDAAPLALRALSAECGVKVKALADFGPGKDYDAEAHVRLLRDNGGASSGYTADMIERLYAALCTPATPASPCGVKALEMVKAAILEADPAVLADTLWMPARFSPNETVVDFIDSAKAAAQADFDQRIRSALAPGVGEVVREEVMRLMREDFDPHPNYELPAGQWDDNADDVADKIIAAVLSTSTIHVTDAWRVLKKWLAAYADEEANFSRYRDDVVLDGVMTAQQRRQLWAIVNAGSTPAYAPSSAAVREAVARIIDPNAGWGIVLDSDYLDLRQAQSRNEDMQKIALRKADEVIAILSAGAR